MFKFPIKYHIRKTCLSNHYTLGQQLCDSLIYLVTGFFVYSFFLYSSSYESLTPECIYKHRKRIKYQGTGKKANTTEWGNWPLESHGKIKARQKKKKVAVANSHSNKELFSIFWSGGENKLLILTLPIPYYSPLWMFVDACHQQWRDKTKIELRGKKTVTPHRETKKPLEQRPWGEDTCWILY